MKKYKKILILILCMALCLACFATGCKDDEEELKYAEYFNDFASAEPYSKAEETLVLPDGVTVSSYDGMNDVYVIQKTYTYAEQSFVRYGFCSDTAILIEPMYEQIVDIRGDYAIVAKAMATGAELSTNIGVVKFRGDNKCSEFGFSYGYAAYVAQYSFLNDTYLSVLGSMTYTDDDLNSSTTGTYTYATIYDYSSANGEAALELGRVPRVTNESKFILQDSVLAVSDTDIFYFYDINKISSGGFTLLQKYIPFSEEEGYTASYVDTDAYYIGNNWFVLSSYYTISDSEPDYYEMKVEDEEDETTYYITIKSVRYNPVSNISYSCDRVVLVANEYNARYINDLANSGNTDEFYYEEEGSSEFTHYYATPMMPVSSIIKHGYSIAYYYYPILTQDGVTGSYTFCIMDEYCNIINLSDLLFPLVTVDGYGVQSPDPNFDMPFSNAVVFTLSPEAVTLEEIPQDEDGNDLAGFYVTAPNSGMVLAYRYDTKRYTTMMGAYDLEKKALTVPYEFAELSLFVGDYALGTKYEVLDAEKGTYKIHYYRVSKTGESEEIADCVAMKNGVYMTKAENLTAYGLKTNDGTVLLENRYNTVSIVESFLTDGKMFKTAVFATEGNPETGVKRGVIFRLS